MATYYRLCTRWIISFFQYMVGIISNRYNNVILFGRYLRGSRFGLETIDAKRILKNATVTVIKRGLNPADIYGLSTWGCVIHGKYPES